MKAVVTGGAGFIGSHLVDRLLAGGYHVTVIDDLSTGVADRPGHAHEACELVVAALPSQQAGDAILSAAPDLIFHLAAQPSVPPSIVDPMFDAERNILASLRVLEAARQVGTPKIIYAASGGALYGTNGPFPSQEVQRWRPEHPYGISKAVVLQYLDFYRTHYGVPSAALALANIYGPRQSGAAEGGVVAIFTQRALAGKTLTINGDGSQTRDFVYVADVVEAFVAAAESDAQGLINIASGVETTVLELAETVQALLSGVEIVHGPPRPMDVARSVLDPSRAKELLSWQPKTRLADGVARVAEYFSGTDLRSPA